MPGLSYCRRACCKRGRRAGLEPAAQCRIDRSFHRRRLARHHGAHGHAHLGRLEAIAGVEHRIEPRAAAVTLSPTTISRSAPNDPHYLCVTSLTLLANHINGHIPLTYTDFTPLAVLLTEYIAIAVRADSPLKTGKEFVEALKKAPASLSLALEQRAGRHAPYFVRPAVAVGRGRYRQSQIRCVQFVGRGGDRAAGRARRRHFRGHGQRRAVRGERQAARAGGDVRRSA